MYIKSMSVIGELGFKYDFKDINILLGSNKTGKTTFTKLLLYSLGVHITDFIPEISQQNKCNNVSVLITTKSQKSFYISRKLPDSEYVTVIPVSSDGELIQTDAQILNMSEYSDLLLDEELYSKEVITYSGNKTASLRYYFLLRAGLVDQTTSHSKVLANLSGEQNDFISNQILINSAIIEQWLNKSIGEIQKLKLELKEKEKERSRITEKIAFIKENLDKQYEANPDYPHKLDAIDRELVQMKNRKDLISAEKYKTLLEYENANDKKLEKEINIIKTEIKEYKERLTMKKLELFDIKSIKTKLSEELILIKKKLIANVLIQKIPVQICPICFSQIEQDELCPNCKNIEMSDNIDNMAAYKQMVEESIKEADSLIDRIELDIKDTNFKISEKEKKSINDTVRYLEKIDKLKSPLEELIVSLKESINDLARSTLILSQIRDNVVSRMSLEKKREDVNEEINDIKTELELKDRKSSNDILIFDKWNELFGAICNDIFGENVNATLSKENYLPILNDIPINRVSSASEKLVARLAFVVSLYKLEKYLNPIKINPLRLVLFDSPKDKDLDIDKYRRFLNQLLDSESGQLFLTGSVRDISIYLSIFNENDILDQLDNDRRLLIELKKDGSS